MLSRTVARVGFSVARSAESSLLAKSTRLGIVALNSTQAASESTGVNDKYELKDAKGIRIPGSEYVNIVRERIGLASASEDEEYQVPRGAFEAIVKEYDVLNEEVISWKDKYTRSLAETENVRRRGVKQVEDTKQFAVQGFCKDMLEVADILDLAVQSVKDEDLKDKRTKDLHDGMVMTRNVLLKTFARHGLRPSNPIGEKFDPNLHEAVFQVPKEQAKVDVGHVEHVMKIGYLLKDRPIRPAQVGVVKE